MIRARDVPTPADTGPALSRAPHRSSKRGGVSSAADQARTEASPNSARDSTKPMRAMAPWITVQVARVCFMSMPKNRLTSQNPESLTWEKPTDPADIAITIATIRSEEHTSELQ